MTSVGIVTGAGRGIGAACAARLAGAVDVLLLADLDEASVAARASELTRDATACEPFVLDVVDAAALHALASRAAARGMLRAVVHAAGISPTMGDWRRILDVDLVGTARLVDALRPLVTEGTAIVCFASMAAHLSAQEPNPEADAAIDDPLAPGFSTRTSPLSGIPLGSPARHTRGRSAACIVSFVGGGGNRPARCTHLLRVAGDDRYADGPAGVRAAADDEDA